MLNQTKLSISIDNNDIFLDDLLFWNAALIKIHQILTKFSYTKQIIYNQIMVKTRKANKQQVPPKAEKTKSKSKDIVKTKEEDSPKIEPKVARGRAKRSATVAEQAEKIREEIAHDYTLVLESGIYKVKIHQNYEIDEKHELYKDINNLFLLFKQKEERRCMKTHKIIPYSNFPLFQFKLKGQKASENKCSICQFEFQDVENFQDELVKDSDEDIIILPCSHIIHRSCFNMLKGTNQWIKCPVCSSIYGMMMGDQPAGSMTWSVSDGLVCDGYPDVGTITINYSMHSGKRGDIHFPGTHRTAYLPNNTEGKEVLKLLQQAFKRKLIFTIGRSVTTGRDNQVVWNGIHHKTNTSGGSAYFGYPDDTYFKRVKLQLAAKGIY